jgi:hypothetical protein
MRLASVVLALLFAISCDAAAPAIPTFELPSFDSAAIDRLVDDALAEVDRLADAPLELPADLARTLEANDIRLPALPTNADEICSALGTPGVGSLTAGGFSTLIEQLVVGSEVGLVVGLLVVVVSRTCPVWMPHLETAVEQLL